MNDDTLLYTELTKLAKRPFWGSSHSIRAHQLVKEIGYRAGCHDELLAHTAGLEALALLGTPGAVLLGQLAQRQGGTSTYFETCRILIQAGNPDAREIIVWLTQKGSRLDRESAQRVLADWDAGRPIRP